MKQTLLKTWLMLLCLLAGVGTSWAENFSTTYDYDGLKATTPTWSLTNYTDQSTYYQVPTGTGVTTSVASISGLFTGKTITSNVVVTINCATYGSGTNPSASTFALYKETACTNAITATQGGTLPTSSTYTNVTYTITQANAASLGNDLAIKITKPGKTIRLKSIKVAFTYTTSGGGDPEPTKYTVTVANNIANGTVVANPTSAAEGATVTLTATPADGYEFGSWNVTNASTSAAIKVTDNKFTMPAANVNVSATFNEIQGAGDEPSGDETTVTMSTFTAISGKVGDDANVTYLAEKGSASTAPAVNNGEIRVYQNGGLFTVTAANGYKLKSVTIGSSMATSVKFKKDGGAEQPTTAHNIAANGKYTVSQLDNSSIQFICKGTTTSSRLYVNYLSVTYAADGSTPDPEKTLVSIAATGTPASFWKGDAFNHNGITVTATWEDETQTDVTSSCKFTGYDMSTPGQQTVTVTYKEKTTTYDINVQTIANTQETAYTVAEAKALIDAGKDLATEVYVAGTISSIVKLESDNSISYFVSADGSTTGQQFEFYKNKKSSTSAWTAVTDVAVGDEVIGYGKLTKYSSTYEFAAGNYLVSHVTSTKKTPTISFAPASVTAYMDAQEEFTAPEVSVSGALENELTYASSNTDVATVNATTGAITFVAAGTTTITASVAETAEHKAASGSYTLVVKANKPVLVKRAIVAEKDGKWYAATTEVSSSKLVAVEVSVFNNKVYYTGTATIDWYYDASNNTIENGEGKKLSSAGSNANVNLTGNNTTWTVDATNGLVNSATNTRALFYSTATNGVFGNYAVAANLGKNENGYSGKASLLEIATTTDLGSVTCMDVDYYSFGSSEAFLVPAGITAYTATIDDNKLSLNEVEAGTVIAGGKGIVFTCAAAESADVEVKFFSCTETPSALENQFSGSSTATTPDQAKNDYYILAKKNEVVGFYHYTKSAAIAANKAFIALPKSADAPSYFGLGDDETAIENVLSQDEATEAYDLMGRRVQKGYKGIVVLNGKKMLVK